MLKQLISGVAVFLGVLGMAQAADDSTLNPWKIEAGLGQSYYSGAANHDGTTAFGRLSIGRDLFFTPIGTWGIELGVQSGNTMHLNLPKEIIDALGGVPVEVEIKPSLDVLVSFQSKPLNQVPLNLWLSGGAAYRTVRVDRESINDLSEYSPEFQVGIGYRINDRTTLNVGYQLIYGKISQLNVNPELETGVLVHLPLQQVGLMGISYHFM